MDKDQMATHNEIYTITNYILNSVSILFSSLLLIIIVTLRIKEINFSNRISLSLIMYISITEIFFSTAQMLRIGSYRYSMWASYISSWGCVFSILLICFLIISILINIQLTLTYNFKDIMHIKKYYFAISFSIAIILSVIPIFFETFVFDQERNYYWYSTVNWEWMTYYGWITFSILYCMISAIFILYCLNKRPNRTTQILPYLNVSTSIILSSPQKQPTTQSKLLSKYISRIAFYSLIPILSYLPTIISNVVHYYSNNNFFFLDLLSLIFISSQSIFTFIIFLFDPIVDEVILEHKRNLKHKQYVLENIKKGVYVNDIYNINFELPSNKDQNENKKRHRTTIKNRISGITSVLYDNRKRNGKSADVKFFNLDIFNDEEALRLL